MSTKVLKGLACLTVLSTVLLFTGCPCITPELKVDTELLVFEVSEGTKTFTISAVGWGELDWMAFEGIPWLNLSSIEGTVDENGQTVTVTVDRSKLVSKSVTKAAINITAAFQTKTVQVALIRSNEAEGLALETALSLAKEAATTALGPTPLMVGAMGVGIDENGMADYAESADNPGWGFLFVDAAVQQGFRVNVTPDGWGSGIVYPDDAPYPLPDGHPSIAASEYASEHVEDWMEIAQAELAVAAQLIETETVDAMVFVGVDADGTEDAIIAFYEESDRASDWSTMDWVSLIRGADVAIHLDAGTGVVEARSYDIDLEAALAAAEIEAATVLGENPSLVGIMGIGIDENGFANPIEAGDNAGWGFLFVDAAVANGCSVSVIADGTRGGIVGSSGSYILPAERHPTVATSAYTAEHVVGWMQTALMELAAVDHLIGTDTVDALIFAGVDQDGTEDVIVAFYEESDMATDWATVDWLSLIRGADVAIHLDALGGDVEEHSFDMGLDEALSAAEVKAYEMLGPDFILTAITGLWIGVDGETEELADNPGWGFIFVDATASNGIRVSVLSGTLVDSTNVFPVPIGMSTQAITRPTGDTIVQFVATALTELAQNPLGTATLDIVTFIGTDPTDATEDAVVVFYEEADMATDWSTMDWLQVLRNGDAAVHLNALTGAVESRSWDIP